MPRLFVAVDLPEQYAPQMQSLTDHLFKASWTKPDQYHLTLKFIGEVDSNRLNAIIRALSIAKSGKLELQISGLGTFPSINRARVLFAQVLDNPELMQLQRQVEAELARVGIEQDPKPFHPHFTLARLRETNPPLVWEYIEKHQDFTIEPFQIDNFYLYQSTLKPTGALHDRIQTYPLG